MVEVKDTGQCSPPQDLHRGKRSRHIQLVGSLLFTTMLCLLMACSSETPEITTTDNVSDDAVDQQSGGLSVGEKWRCIEQPSESTIQEEESVALFRVVPLAGPVTLNDIEVHACRMEDPLCEEPVAGPFYTREDGTVAVPVPTDPYVFFTFEHEDIVPVIAGGFLPVFPSDYVVEVGVFTAVQLGGVLGLTGFESTYGQDTGHLLIVAHDCERNASPDLKLTVSPEGGELYYLRGTLPRLDEEETDASGTGGFIGIEPGYKTLSYEIAESSTSVASMTAPVRGGWFTEVYLTPYSQEIDASSIDGSLLTSELPE